MVRPPTAAPVVRYASARGGTEFASLWQLRAMIALLIIMFCGNAVATPASNPCVVKNRVNGVSTDGSGGTDTTYTSGDSVFKITGCNNTLSSNNVTNVTVFGDNNVVSSNEVRAQDSNGNRVLTIGIVTKWVNNSVIMSNVAGAPLAGRV